MRIGDQGPGSGNWWSSGALTHEERPCLFDDEYVFNSDGTFQNILVMRLGLKAGKVKA